jgi:hypothetical protein
MQLRILKFNLNFEPLMHYMFRPIWLSSGASKLMLKIKFKVDFKILSCMWDGEIRSGNMWHATGCCNTTLFVYNLCEENTCPYAHTCIQTYICLYLWLFEYWWIWICIVVGVLVFYEVCCPSCNRGYVNCGGGSSCYMRFVAQPVIEDCMSTVHSSSPLLVSAILSSVGNWSTWPPSDRTFCDAFRILFTSKEIFCSFSTCSGGSRMYGLRKW